MKVLLLGNKIFTIDMYWGFLQAGCQAQIAGASYEGQIANMFANTEVNLLMTMGAPLELKKPVMEYIGNHRPAGLKYIHWDTDGISSTYFQSLSGDGIEMDVIYSAKPDLVLSVCPEMRNLITSKGFVCEMMYYGWSPVSHQPMPYIHRDDQFINLIGNSYISIHPYHPDHYRYKSIEIILKPLLENHYNVHFYSDTGYRSLIQKLFDIDVPQECFHGYLPYDRTCAAYSDCFINLATQNHEHTITKRTFEILASGGFALSSDNAELRKLFVPGRDLAVSSSPEETLELVKYYDTHPEEYRKVREQASLSVQNHSYKQRAEFILEKYKQL